MGSKKKSRKHVHSSWGPGNPVNYNPSLLTPASRALLASGKDELLPFIGLLPSCAYGCEIEQEFLSVYNSRKHGQPVGTSVHTDQNDHHHGIALTVVVELSPGTDYTSGGTLFSAASDFVFRPSPGNAVLFGGDVQHAGHKVKSGLRIAWVLQLVAGGTESANAAPISSMTLADLPACGADSCAPEGGYDAAGFDPDGYDRQGFDSDGFDRAGYNAKGFDAEGFNRHGRDMWGFYKNGFDRQGRNKYIVLFSYLSAGLLALLVFDVIVYDEKGFDREGYNRSGFNAQGLRRQQRR